MATQRVYAANNITGKFTLGNFRGPLQLSFQGTDGRKIDCFLLKFSLTSSFSSSGMRAPLQPTSPSRAGLLQIQRGTPLLPARLVPARVLLAI